MESIKLNSILYYAVDGLRSALEYAEPEDLKQYESWIVSLHKVAENHPNILESTLEEICNALETINEMHQ